MGLGQHPHNVVALKDAGRDQGCLGGCLVCTPKEGRSWALWVARSAIPLPNVWPTHSLLAYPLTSVAPHGCPYTSHADIGLSCRLHHPTQHNASERPRFVYIALWRRRGK